MRRRAAVRSSARWSHSARWTAVSLVAASLLLVPACGRDQRVIRDWRPEDHAQPGGGAAPGENAAEGEGEATGTPEEQELRAVTALYGVSCASCHGQLGAGDGPEATPEAPMRSFADPEWQASRTDAQIATAISDGMGTMQGFSAEVNERGIAALVRYVRMLGAPAAPPSEPALGPRAPAPTAPGPSARPAPTGAAPARPAAAAAAPARPAPAPAPAAPAPVAPAPAP